MRLHALELLPDEAGTAAVRRDWQALRDAGLASQLDHTGTTNAPHLTLVAAPDVSAAAARAAQLVGSLLPVEVRASGLVLLGGEKVTVARALDVPDALLAAVLELRRLAGQARHPGWLAHVTLARRLPRAEIQRAVDVLAHADVVLSMAELRRWNPDAESVEVLA